MARRASATLKWLAVSFLVAAISCLGAMLWIGRSGDALTLPISLQSDFGTTQKFDVPAKALYRIELRCSRTIPFEELKKRLQGGNLVLISMTDNGATMPVHYLPEFGNLGFAQAWISQDIAVFSGDPSRVYEISCSVIRPLAQLNETKPTLVVGLDPSEIEEGAVLSFLLFAAAALFGIVSLMTGLIYLWMRHRASRAQYAEV